MGDGWNSRKPFLPERLSYNLIEESKKDEVKVDSWIEGALICRLVEAG